MICHSSDDRRIALIEVMSAKNKSRDREFESFVAKALDSLDWSHHLLLIDLHPRTNRDPHGIHSIEWTEVGGQPMPIPAENRLTLAAYDVGPPPTAHVEPVAAGDTLIDMPLFLAPEWYVSVPLEATYQSAYRGTPRPFREILDAGT